MAPACTVAACRDDGESGVCCPYTRSVFAGSCRKARLKFSEGKDNDINVYIGRDVSLASTAICMLNEKGKIATEPRVASTPEALVAFLRKLPHGIAVMGLDAGPLSQRLHKGLTEADFEAVLMETRQVKGALKAILIKTDRRDAEGIVRPLQTGWFRRCTARRSHRRCEHS